MKHPLIVYYLSEQPDRFDRSIYYTPYPPTHLSPPASSLIKRKSGVHPSNPSQQSHGISQNSIRKIRGKVGNEKTLGLVGWCFYYYGTKPIEYYYYLATIRLVSPFSSFDPGWFGTVLAGLLACWLACLQRLYIHIFLASRCLLHIIHVPYRLPRFNGGPQTNTVARSVGRLIGWLVTSKQVRVVTDRL